jgi:hypothetical protein
MQLSVLDQCNFLRLINLLLNLLKITDGMAISCGLGLGALNFFTAAPML